MGGRVAHESIHESIHPCTYTVDVLTRRGPVHAEAAVPVARVRQRRRR
jgi:hypothetical protein